MGGDLRGMRSFEIGMFKICSFDDEEDMEMWMWFI